MTNSEIYNQRFQQLQREFIAAKKKKANKWQYKPHQQAMYDFVVYAKRMVEFSINDYTIVLRIGNDDFGFRHILLRHYCDECVGRLFARDILNIGNIIKNDIELPAHRNRIKFIQNKGDIKYTVILTSEYSKRLVFTYFSSEPKKAIEIKLEDSELGQSKRTTT
ncbi:MAG: hypothetical protein U9P72_06735 [Campylobacterota bacterium]|nr:hypothetical protein [Campylobacterota bacterium]